MATPEKQRPRHKNLDDLFNMARERDGSDQESPTHLRVPSNDRYQSVVELDKLVSFAGHPFRLYEGERLDDMVESVRRHGVLVPIIARQQSDLYEILAGHNRVNAARIAGLSNIPAILLKNVSGEEAMIIVVETNLMQRSFSDMSHSEKAAVIYMQHTKLFSQGKRNDIIQALRAFENPNEIRENGTCCQVGKKLDSGLIISKEYGLSSRTVARYLRIHQLIPALKALLDDDAIAFIPAVTLSFLREREQNDLAHCIELNGFTIDMRKADILRQYSEDGKLDDERIYFILNGELGQKPKPNRTPVVKIKKTVYAQYFRPNQSAKEVEQIVERALELYFEQHRK